jgi:hypothetical protein
MNNQEDGQMFQGEIASPSNARKAFMLTIAPLKLFFTVHSSSVSAM